MQTDSASEPSCHVHHIMPACICICSMMSIVVWTASRTVSVYTDWRVILLCQWSWLCLLASVTSVSLAVPSSPSSDQTGVDTKWNGDIKQLLIWTTGCIKVTKMATCACTTARSFPVLYACVILYCFIWDANIALHCRHPYTNFVSLGHLLHPGFLTVINEHHRGLPYPAHLTQKEGVWCNSVTGILVYSAPHPCLVYSNA